MADMTQNQIRLKFTEFTLNPNDPDVMRRVMDLEADVLTFEEGAVTLWLRGVEVGVFPSASLSAVELSSSAPLPASPAYSVDEVRKQHGNAYQRWSREDEQLLLELHAAGHSVDALAQRFGRQPSAIRSRLVKLGVEGIHVPGHQGATPPF
ncbi:helix-turn-helix domain-containing protein [Streptomyces sp. NPDC001773]|uniref:helix-turn-helix domain-containing protein n=1 Tax=Streptomyces sp. NPDC005499 TaxID=3154883 RepID=UPI0033ACFA0E